MVGYSLWWNIRTKAEIRSRYLWIKNFKTLQSMRKFTIIFRKVSPFSWWDFPYRLLPLQGNHGRMHQPHLVLILSSNRPLTWGPNAGYLKVRSPHKHGCCWVMQSDAKKVVRLSVLASACPLYPQNRYFFCFFSHSSSLLLYEERELLAGFEIIFRLDAS